MPLVESLSEEVALPLELQGRGVVVHRLHGTRPGNVIITVKVDVYNFGVMLLEIICCKKTVHLDDKENEILLCDWVYECFRHGRLVQLVEQQQLEGDTIEPRQLERLVLTALWCIQDNSALRPSIEKVVQMLEGAVEITVPPTP
ncbi:G-type lectin S-receptor-like serine/threonine-protein kinase RLK1 [Cryptomeria japonica]|uniref:G-type lectin S-receptor-like serine/threonine-protein kinase RLK1 n=1 Tax=Cryptomeria japonica TaxID=3369 RepID=UPI0027D9E409|nr:G-type lectin S-receptor-like serine/threonine-protein kinase RLK1 [Cryptomeria japonica]